MRIRQLGRFRVDSVTSVRHFPTGGFESEIMSTQTQTLGAKEANAIVHVHYQPVCERLWYEYSEVKQHDTRRTMYVHVYVYFVNAMHEGRVRNGYAGSPPSLERVVL